MANTFFLHRRALLRAGLATCGIAALGGIAGAAYWRPPLGQYRFRGTIMGTIYNVTLIAPIAERALRDAARAAVRAAFASVDAAMSIYKPGSELSRLNGHRRETPHRLSGDTFNVLIAAQRVSAACGGSFDVTAGPLVDAWGFGPRKEPRIPSAAELSELRRQVGYRLLELDPRERTVTKTHRDMRLDFGGIAKGYGIDLAAQALDALGIGDYVVELGGEVRARGRNVRDEPWQVAIEQPQAGPSTARSIVPLDGRALATSGDYRIFFERNGWRYSHMIDPASAGPVRHGLTSVTVVASECALADAWATALMVLGPERGYSRAESLGLAAHFIVRSPDGLLRDRQTAMFAALKPRPAIS